jgi:hypothetical protein
MRLSRTTEESAVADEAVRALAGRMQTESFAQLFKQYNGSGRRRGRRGQGPGANFDVSASRRARGRRRARRAHRLPGGRPSAAASRSCARTSSTRAWHGDRSRPGPRRVIDATDHSSDYAILPVRLIVEWTGAGGNRSYELDVVLVP